VVNLGNKIKKMTIGGGDQSSQLYASQQQVKIERALEE